MPERISTNQPGGTERIFKTSHIPKHVICQPDAFYLYPSVLSPGIILTFAPASGHEVLRSWNSVSPFIFTVRNTLKKLSWFLLYAFIRTEDGNGPVLDHRALPLLYSYSNFFSSVQLAVNQAAVPGIIFCCVYSKSRVISVSYLDFSNNDD